MESILLGLVQGLTEFLPISSSGHLVLFQTVLGVKGPTLFFDLILHFGTLLSILVYFRSDFIAPGKMLIERLGPGKNREIAEKEPWFRDEHLKMWYWVLVGSVPTFVLALMLHNPAEKAFHSVKFAAAALILTGLLLALTRWIKKEGRDITEITIFDALVIGMVQGFAVFPGISRSGTTIVAGLAMGLRGSSAAKFSFLLSVPAIVGAIAFQILKQGGIDGNSLPVALLGCGVAFISGLFAIRSVIGLVSVGRLFLFAFYCIPLGLVVLTTYWLF